MLTITAAEFSDKWKRSTRTERSASQDQFIDLCELVGHARPAEADPKGESFTFEKGAAILGRGKGWADSGSGDTSPGSTRGRRRISPKRSGRSKTTATI